MRGFLPFLWQSQECSSVAQALKDVDHPYLSIAEDKSKASTSLLSLMRTTWSSMREQILSKPSTFACHSNCLLLKTVVPAFFLANKFSSMPRLAPLSPYSLTIFWLKAVSFGPTNHVAVIDLYARGNTPFHFNVHPIFMSWFNLFVFHSVFCSLHTLIAVIWVYSKEKSSL